LGALGEGALVRVRRCDRALRCKKNAPGASATGPAIRDSGFRVLGAVLATPWALAAMLAAQQLLFAARQRDTILLRGPRGGVVATADKQKALKSFQREGERSQLELPAGESQLAPNAKIMSDYSYDPPS